MRSLTVARAFGALLAAAALAAPLHCQAQAEADPIEVSAKKLESSLERAEAAAKKLAAARASKPKDAGSSSAAAKGASDKAAAEASDRAKKDAERIQRIEQQLEDQRKANARSLLDLQTQLAEVKASLEARAVLAEKERDAAREDTATLVRAQRDLLDAVRAQRAAVQELIRAAEAALTANNAQPAPQSDAAQPRRRARATAPRVDS
jgi:colicin import membrane protein